MPKKFYSENFGAQPKPKITRHDQAYGLVLYTWRCMDTATGSIGYGTTAVGAYARWLRNWTARKKWYQRSDEHWTNVLKLHDTRERV